MKRAWYALSAAMTLALAACTVSYAIFAVPVLMRKEIAAERANSCGPGCTVSDRLPTYGVESVGIAILGVVLLVLFLWLFSLALRGIKHERAKVSTERRAAKLKADETRLARQQTSCPHTKTDTVEEWHTPWNYRENRESEGQVLRSRRICKECGFTTPWAFLQTWEPS